MSSVCWLEDRDDRLARARALAPIDPRGALALVESVLAEVSDDPEALRAKGAVLVDVADAERDAGRAVTLYDEAIALLGCGSCPADADLAAAQRGRAAAVRQRDSERRGDGTRRGIVSNATTRRTAWGQTRGGDS